MKNNSTKFFWILTDALFIFAIPFFPSFFSVFCILAAIIFLPIEPWQDIINKYLKKSIKSFIIAILVAFVVALFPLSAFVTGIYKLANPENTSSDNSTSIVYYEQTPSSSNVTSTENTYSDSFTTSDTETSSAITESKNTTSSKVSLNNYSSKSNHTSTYSTSSKPVSSSNHKQESVNSKPSNSNSVYRTPSGKRYHSSPTCGGKNSFSVSYEDAVNDGLTPCKKCVK